MYIDALAELIQQEVSDNEATREDWERALNRVFGK